MQDEGSIDAGKLGGRHPEGYLSSNGAPTGVNQSCERRKGRSPAWRKEKSSSLTAAAVLWFCNRVGFDRAVDGRKLFFLFVRTEGAAFGVSRCLSVTPCCCAGPRCLESSHLFVVWVIHTLISPLSCILREHTPWPVHLAAASAEHNAFHPSSTSTFSASTVCTVQNECLSLICPVTTHSSALARSAVRLEPTAAASTANAASTSSPAPRPNGSGRSNGTTTYATNENNSALSASRLGFPGSHSGENQQNATEASPCMVTMQSCCSRLQGLCLCNLSNAMYRSSSHTCRCATHTAQVVRSASGTCFAAAFLLQSSSAATP